MSYACDKCSQDAVWLQPKYRGNSDDRHGPLVLFRCDKHRDLTLQADPIPERLTSE